MINSKIYLGCITNGPVEVLKENFGVVKDYFDGLCFCVDDRADDDVYDYLDSIKKEGQIVKQKFRNAHDWQANEWLHCGAIKPYSWVCVVDTSDKLNPVFLKRMREDISYWEKNGIHSIFIDHPFLFKFSGHQYFSFSPHWGLNNLFTNFLDLRQISDYKKELYVFNTRDIYKSGIEHPIKYSLEYKRSNNFELLYGQFGTEVYSFHESKRVWFQSFVEQVLGFDCTVDNLINFFTDGIRNKSLPLSIVEYAELEVHIKDLVRYYILKHDFLGEIAPNRFNWSFKKFYYDGVEHQSLYDGYIGVFNSYRLKQGKKME